MPCVRPSRQRFSSTWHDVFEHTQIPTGRTRAVCGARGAWKRGPKPRAGRQDGKIRFARAGAQHYPAAVYNRPEGTTRSSKVGPPPPAPGAPSLDLQRTPARSLPGALGPDNSLSGPINKHFDCPGSWRPLEMTTFIFAILLSVCRGEPLTTVSTLKTSKRAHSDQSLLSTLRAC